MNIDELSIDPRLIDFLKSQGYIKFYPPQENAIKAGILDEKNILVSTIKFPYIILSLFFMIAIFVKTNFNEKNFFIFFYLFLNISFTYFVYLSAKPPHFEAIVITRLNRIVFESSAPYLLFMIIYLKKIMKI